MVILDSFPQCSEQWFIEKAGKPGSSSFSKIVTTKGAPSKSAQDYIHQLAGEAIIGRQEEGYTNYAMEAGIAREAESRALFELLHGVEVKQVGLVYRDESRSVLCSPDGLMDDCGLELKNPLLKTHVKYLLAGTLPSEYYQQVHGSMFVTGLKSWFFMSYYPGLPPFILKVARDEDFISKLEKEMDSFLFKLAILIRKIKEMG